MFLVPTYEDLPDGTRKRIVTLERIEEKLGHHGSVTAALAFDRAPAELVGERGRGLQVHAGAHEQRPRSASGFECHRPAARRRCGWRAAYAAERQSMGKTIDRHEMIADYLDEMRTDIQALRALAMHGAFHEELAQKIELIVRYGDIAAPTETAARARDRRATSARRAA